MSPQTDNAIVRLEQRQTKSRPTRLAGAKIARHQYCLSAFGAF